MSGLFGDAENLFAGAVKVYYFMKTSYKHTIFACYIAYVVQAIVNNLCPLLFLTFQREFDIPIAQIGLLITVNFGVQITVDVICAKSADFFGYRKMMLVSLACTVCGLCGLGLFPYLLGNAFVGLLLAITLNAIGGGVIEVLVSPIVEASPDTTAKAAAMSLLHSFYCWGHVAVVLISTLLFRVFGMANWRFVPFVWAIVPLMCAAMFAAVPINKIVSDEDRLPIKRLFSMKLFWIFMVLMVCSGASELSMSQWSSYFAESSLGVSKTTGDLLGPCAFAFLMGITRLVYGRVGEKIDLEKFMTASGFLCVASYLIAVFSPHPLLSLAGCALCGISVGLMWPGTFSLAAKSCPQGGTAMFAFFAFAGDVGCAAGPGTVSVVSQIFGEFKIGLLCGIIFPLLLLTILFVLRKTK